MASHIGETNFMLARLRVELERPPFNKWLGVSAVAVKESGPIIVALPYRPEFSYDPDRTVFHGGVLASLIDIAGYAAIAIRCDVPTPTVSLHIDYMAPAIGDDLAAHSHVRRIGRSLSRVDVEVFAGTSMVAMGRGIFSTRERST